MLIRVGPHRRFHVSLWVAQMDQPEVANSVQLTMDRHRGSVQLSRWVDTVLRMLVADLHHFLDLPDDIPGPAAAWPST